MANFIVNRCGVTENLNADIPNFAQFGSDKLPFI